MAMEVEEKKYYLKRLRTFYTKEEWEGMGDYEKASYCNILRNHDELKKLGLKPKLPSYFTGRRPNEPSSESDEEWKPNRSKPARKKGALRLLSACQPKKQQGRSALKKVSIDSDSSKARQRTRSHKIKRIMQPIKRHSKRIVLKKNYTEDEVPKDDDFLYCDDCEMEHEGDCPIHGALIHIKNKEAPSDGTDLRRCFHTLPEGLSIKPSSICGAGNGVWSEIDVPKRAMFGPYEGVIIDDLEEAQKSGYCWQVEQQ